MTLLFTHPSSHRHDTGAHPENADRLVAIEAALDRDRPAGARAGRGAGGHPRAAAARAHRRAHRSDRVVRRRRGRDDRRRHDRLRRFVRGGASRGRGRRRGGRAAGRRRGTGGLLRPAAAGPPRGRRSGDGLLPVQQRRGRRPPRDRRLRRRAGADPRLGRPPRQRHRGDLRRDVRRPLLQHPPMAALSGHRRRGVRRRGGGGGLHGQPAGPRRVRAARSSWR